MIFQKFINTKILRNFLFVLVFVSLITMFSGILLHESINSAQLKRIKTISSSFNKIVQQIEQAGIDEKAKKMGTDYSEIFQGYCNVVVTDIFGNILYSKNDSYIPEQKKFILLLNLKQGETGSSLIDNTAYIVDSNNNVKYNVSLNNDIDIRKFTKLDSSKLKSNSYSMFDNLSMFTGVQIKNFTGNIVDTRPDLSLDYSFVGSKNLNIYGIYERRYDNVGGWEGSEKTRLFASRLQHIGIVLVILFWLLLPIWVFKDADKRGFRAPLWGILTLVINVVGLIIYLVVRPENKCCSNCKEQLSYNFIVCPYCGTKNREICSSCKQILEENWLVCPYCGEPKQAHVTTNV